MIAIPTLLAGENAPGDFLREQAQLPDGFPTPKVPQDNPLSQAKIALGRFLFYETKLAMDGKTSCASCHNQALAFTDGKGQAIGATGQRHSRGAMSLTNVAYNASLTWSDPEMDRLENQAIVPLFNRHPIEMGLQGREAEVLGFLGQNSQYKALFQAAFPQQPSPTLVQITHALASFQRTFISFSSEVDAVMMDDAHPPQRDAILRGFSLFFSDKLNCGKCHGGFNFSGPVISAEKSAPATFHHNGLLGVGPAIDELALDPGLATHTGQPSDWGKFRAPTLRNIAVTAPYMHRGQLASLEDVLDHYSNGGQDHYEKGSGGRDHPNKSPLIKPFTISQAERANLLIFLRNLTDQAFLTRSDLAAPEPIRP